jgi:hypothetical protein
VLKFKVKVTCIKAQNGHSNINIASSGKLLLQAHMTIAHMFYAEITIDTYIEQDSHV